MGLLVIRRERNEVEGIGIAFFANLLRQHGPVAGIVKELHAARRIGFEQSDPTGCGVERAAPSVVDGHRADPGSGALAKLGRASEALEEYRRARAAYETVVAAVPSNAWTSGMLAMLYVSTAELESGADRAASCQLYAKAMSLFEPIAAAGVLPPDRQELFERAKAQIAGCPGAAGR
jgi:hypothetical protein